MRLLSLVIVAGAWEIAGRTLDSLLLPAFSETVIALVRMVATRELWEAFWISNQALLIGYAAALAIGLPLGILMGGIRPLGRIIGTYLMIMLVTPTTALIPLIIIAAGLNVTARSIIVFLFAIPFITLNTRAGLSDIDTSLVEMARSFCASRAQIIWRTVLPAAVPAIMLGVRVGLGRAITGMINVELVLVAVGLGRLLLNYQTSFLAAQTYAVVLVILFEAVLLMRFARWLENRAAPWAAYG